MENNPLSQRTVGFGLALAVTCLVNAIIVIVKEKSDPVMNAMKGVTGHHWKTHSLAVIFLFFALGAVLAALRAGGTLTSNRLVGIVVSAVGAATLLIVGFYLFAD
jgi:hypothetical protein